ncbi:MAG TPA: inhibitor of sigma-G Gin [Desulfosporosinus sp.]
MMKDSYTQTQIFEENHEKVTEHETFANEGKILPVCYRCAQVPKNGLYDGFRVEGMFFCSDCQLELFTAEQGSPEYQEFIFLIKEILL